MVDAIKFFGIRNDEDSTIRIGGMDYQDLLEGSHAFDSMPGTINNVTNQNDFIQALENRKIETQLFYFVGDALISFINLDLHKLKSEYLSKLNNEKKSETITHIQQIWRSLIGNHIYFFIDNYLAYNVFEMDFDYKIPMWDLIDEVKKWCDDKYQMYDFMKELIDEFFQYIITIQTNYRCVVDNCLKMNGDKKTPVERLYIFIDKNTTFSELGQSMSAVYFTPQRLKSGKIALLEAYSIEYFTTLSYIELAQMIKKNIPVKECPLCKEYFVLNNTRKDAIYCDNCRKNGAKIAYKQKVAKNDLLRIFNREYQRRYARLRNYDKSMRKIKVKELNDNWVKKAKLKMNEENLTSDKFEKWIEEERERE